MAAEQEEVVDPVMGGEEALCLARRLEPLHLPFSSSRRLMRVLRPVIEPLVLPVLDRRHHRALGRAVTRQLVRDHDTRHPALPLHQLAQQALGGPRVAVRYDRLILHVSSTTSELAGRGCGARGVQWAQNTYADANGLARGLLRAGKTGYYFITVDYAFGHAVEADMAAAVRAGGGTVAGGVRHPLNSGDFASFLASAQSSGAQVVVLANSGADFITAVKGSAARLGVVTLSSLIRSEARLVLAGIRHETAPAYAAYHVARCPTMLQPPILRQSRPVGHQGAEMRLKPVQLGCRPAMRGPVEASLDPATRGTTKAGKPHRSLAEERRHRMVPVALHTTDAVTVRALRPPNRMAPSLRGDDLPLNARQQPLRFEQGQTQVGDVDEVIGPSDLQDVCARPLALSPDPHQPQHPSHASTLGQRTNAKIANWPPHPQSCDGPTRHRGTERVGWMFTFVAAAYNLVRQPKLLAGVA